MKKSKPKLFVVTLPDLQPGQDLRTPMYKLLQKNYIRAVIQKDTEGNTRLVTRDLNKREVVITEKDSVSTKLTRWKRILTDPGYRNELYVLERKPEFSHRIEYKPKEAQSKLQSIKRPDEKEPNQKIRSQAFCL